VTSRSVVADDEEGAYGLGEDRDVLIDFIAGHADHLSEHAPVFDRMCGDSQSANSAVSLMMPRQSALRLPDVGGGEGQLRTRDPLLAKHDMAIAALRLLPPGEPFSSVDTGRNVLTMAQCVWLRWLPFRLPVPALPRH